MRRYLYIICTLALLALYGCQKDIDLGYIEEKPADNIEVLEDGRIRVEVSLKSLGMTSVSTRADLSYENKIYNGWCLVFGETDGGENLHSDGCGDDSPLIQAVPIIANEAGKFFMTFEEYKHKAFIRIAANLTARENENFANVNTWQSVAPKLGLDPATLPSHADVEQYRDDNRYNLATFGEYRQQSVGLDGLYNITYNTTSELEFDSAGHTDYSGVTTYWNINYQNGDFPGIKGFNYITNEPETYNGNKPNPTTQLNTTTGFPMSSYDFSLENLTKESIEKAFGTTIEMVRTCSKVMINAADPTFTIQEVYLVDCAQESRIRSTTMDDVTPDNTNDALGLEKQYSIPKDLGGTITYEALKVPEGTTITDPIYFYPNSGQDYINDDGTVNQNTNQQFIVIKGKSAHYDTPGYYKVALKAQYPLVKDPDTSAMGDRDQWTALTYDIWRNTSFTVNLVEVGKPGYKTLENTLDPACPASNINYDITIEHNDNHYEVLVSNGTFHVELETSRVYVKGYMNEGLENCYLDFSLYPSKAGNYVPTVYVQSCDHNGIFNDEDVTIQYCNVMYKGEAGFDSDDWSNAHKVELIDNETGDNLSAQLIKIAKSDKETKVRVFYKVKDSGRIRIHIGDIVKAIPITYDAAPISYLGTNGESVKVKGTYGATWNDFSYREVVYDENHDHAVTGFSLNSNGSVNFNNSDHFNRKPELRARIIPQDVGDGLAVLYLRQASDFKLEDANGDEYIESKDGSYSVDFTAQGKVFKNSTNGLFSGAKGKDEIIFDTREINSESVDSLTISINTVATGESKDDEQFFVDSLSDGDQKLTLSINEMDYSNQVYASRSDIENEIKYNYTATSTITVKNAAGDSKEYTVNQTQYPPIYIVADNSKTKNFNISGNPTNKTNDEVCVYSIKIYGANYTDDSCTVSSEWKLSSGDQSDLDYFKTVMYESILSSDYLTTYGVKHEDYTQKKDFWDWFGDDYTFDRLTGDNYKYNVAQVSTGTIETWTTLAELDKCAPDYNADGCYILIRNSDKIDGGKIDANVTSDVTISITDKYGEVYKSTKQFIGLD